MSNQINYMSIAIEEAMKAKNKQEVPVGAVIVDDKGEVIAKAHNLVELNNNSTCHAEKIVIEKVMTGIRLKANITKEMNQKVKSIFNNKLSTYI